MTGGTVSALALAKLTLSLRVVGVRKDGYHLLDAEMVTVDLADRLEFGDGDGLEVIGGEGLAIPVGPDNLVARAVQALGGGSADAAAVLRWARCTDLDLAARLGGDVPFCLVGGWARVGGIGEQVSPLPFDQVADRLFTLLTPPFGVSTPAVYQAWDRLGGLTARGPNDLEPAAIVVEPRLAEWRDRLGDATGLQPILAGSGSTWFVAGAYPGDGRVVVRVDRPED
jgi:4-diphosphocytidyl-2-C-methyl-D-erythritol kinase